MSYKFIFIVAMLLTITGCGASTTSQEVTSAYTLTDLATHADSESCWMAINGKVYDVTAYIPEHPGQTRITEGCGKDATDLFTGTNPLGRAHSAAAQAILDKYKIGELGS